MGLIAAARRFAFSRPAAFPVIGRGGSDLWHGLVLDGTLVPACAPHNADLLLLCGAVPEEWGLDLLALFETFALPRLAVWVPGTDREGEPAGLPVVNIENTDWAGVRSALLDPASLAAEPLLPDRPPCPWRGLGEHGQGGEGMMGGVPYGRAMAMTADDTDDLALDDVPTVLGPFFPGLPTGLRVELRLQGQRVRSCEAVDNTFPVTGTMQEPSPPTVAALERLRIRNHLDWAGDFLRLLGQEAIGLHLLRAAQEDWSISDIGRMGRLFRLAEAGGLKDLLAGTGRIKRDTALRLGLRGPDARASGVAVDGRSRDEAYAAYSFQPSCAGSGDAWARWTVRCEECLQSLALIDAVGDRTLASGAACEMPRGAYLADGVRPHAPSRANMAAIGEMLPGLTWFGAVAALASLDLDMAEAAGG